MEKPTLSDPPRTLSASTKLAVLFGRPVLQAGFLVMVVGLIMTAVFVLDSELMTQHEIGGRRLEKTSGLVTWRESTSAKENGRRLWRADYVFRLGGRELVGRSYGFAVPAPDTTVTIEYVAAEPTISRIEGLRRHKFHQAVAFVGLTAVVGLGIVLVSLLLGVRELAFLGRAQVGWARFEGMVPTSARVNRRQVMRVEMALVLPDGGTQRIRVRTHRPELLKDDDREQVLFDPAKPSRAVAVDSIWRLVVRDDGTLAPRVSPSLFLILPTLVTAAIAVAALLVL